MKLSRFIKFTLIFNIIIFFIYGCVGILNVLHARVINFSYLKPQDLGYVGPQLIALFIALISCIAFFGRKIILMSALISALMCSVVALVVVLYAMFVKYAEETYGVFHLIVVLIVITPVIINLFSFFIVSKGLNHRISDMP